MIKKKSLGQNFLKSKSVVKDIVNASKISEKIILEIGPGEGMMTEELLKDAKQVIVVEKDHRLIPILEEKFKEEILKNKLVVIEKDILEFDIENLKSYGNEYKVVANIPYYITGQIIRKFLESDYKPISMTLLLQKEVAERIIARDKKESLLSLSVKIFGNPKIIRTVGRGAFSPSPNVDSSVLVIESITDEKLGGLSPTLFFEVLHAGFAHKRKQLLPNLGNSFDKEKIASAFEKIGFNMKIRAEDLSLENWVTLSKLISE